MSEDPNELLMGGGVTSAGFKAIGDVVSGEIMRVESRQQTKFGTGDLLFWPDGNKMMQIMVVLQTPDQDEEDDDGVRSLYVKKPSQMLTAIANAVRGAHAEGLEAGGILSVKYVRDEKPKTKGYNPQKIYEAGYRPPSRVVRVDDGDPGPEESF